MREEWRVERVVGGWREEVMKVWGSKEGVTRREGSKERGGGEAEREEGGLWEGGTGAEVGAGTGARAEDGREGGSEGMVDWAGAGA